MSGRAKRARAVEALVLALLALACDRAPPGAPQATPEAPARSTSAPSATLTLLATGDVGGDTDECGCKLRPLGGVARRVRAVQDRAQARPGAVLVVDAGDLFFKTALPTPRELPAARATAALFADALAKMEVAAMAVGERDLALGLPELRALAARGGTRLLAANLVHAATGTAAFDAYALVERAGVRIGLVGAALELDPAAPEVYARAGLAERPLEPALGAAAKAARAAGADVVVGLLHVGLSRGRAVLERLEPGLIDLAIVAHDRAASNDAEAVGRSAAVMAGERGKWMLALELGVVRGGRGVFNLGAVAAAQRSLEALDERARALEREDAGVSEPALAARLSADRLATIDRLRRRRAQVEGELARASGEGRHALRAELVPIDVGLPEDPELARAVAALKLRAGGAGEGAAGAEATYVGSAACRRCHPAAYAHWLTTPHARAWATLERERQAANLDCVGCHSTGFDRAGGPRGLVGLEKLRSVGCESCHGPGSVHAATPEVRTVVDLQASGAICGECHRPQGEQRPFALADRLPRVLGPGHGSPGPGSKAARRAAAVEGRAR